MSIHDVFLLLGALSPVRYTATECGHRTKRRGLVHAFGGTIITTMPMNKVGSVDYCLDCIGKMAIQCAWCSNPIFIGNPITLYTPCDGFHIPEHAVVFNTEPLQLVGCLGWDCADTGSDRAGFWLPSEEGKGSVAPVPTACSLLLGVGR